MAKILSLLDIQTGEAIEAQHVSQSIIAFTGAEAYDITVSGSFTMQGPLTGTPGILNSFSSSYALTASYVENAPASDTASFVTGSNVYGPYGSNSIISSSNSQTASFAKDAISSSYTLTSSYAVTASFVDGAGIFPFEGDAVITGSLVVSASNQTQALQLYGSGSTIFSIEGSRGTLFTIDDDESDGTLFSVNNVSGTPILEVQEDNTVKLGKQNGFGIVISGSNPSPNDLDANIIITGSIKNVGSSAYFDTNITASGNVSASGFISASSFNSPPGVINQLTASYAISASVEVRKEVSSSYADTASYVETAQTASFVTTAQTASFVTTAQTASYVTTAQTSSYILASNIDQPFTNITASGNISASGYISASSFAGDGSGLTGITSNPFPYIGIAEITGSLRVSGSFYLDYNGNKNIIIGSGSGETLSTGISNIVIGNNSATSLSSGTGNIILGDEAGVGSDFNDENNVIAIGLNAGKNTDFDSNLGDSILIGKNAGRTGNSQNTVAIGTDSGYADNSTYNVLVGFETKGDGTNNVGLGYTAFGNGLHNYSVAIGSAALNGVSSTNSTGNVAIGYQSFRNPDGNDSNYNISIGYQAYGINKITSEGIKNIVLGYKVVPNFFSGSNNIVIGDEAGNELVDGSNNIIIGQVAASGSGDSSDKLFIGSGSSAIISGSLLTGDLIFKNSASAQYFSAPELIINDLTASYAITASHALNVATPTLQIVTDAGPSTTTPITASIISSSANIIAQSFTGSLSGSALEAISSSFAQTASYVKNAQTASYVDASNIKQPFTNLTASNLLITGTASINLLHTTYESSSIIYSSGSTKFGDTFDDFHQFTGSISSTGSYVDFTGATGVSGSFSGSFEGEGSGITGVISSSYALSASFTQTASYVTTAQTASFVTTAQTASFVTTAQTASYVTTAQTASFVTLAQTASFVTTAQTASYVETAQSSSFVTGSNVYGPHGSNSVISSSHAVTASYADTASFIEKVPTADTASFVTGSNVHGPHGPNSIISSSNAQTASFVTLAQTASFVTTAQTASYVTTAQTASFITTAQTASYVTTAQTASYVTTAQTASFVTTAQTASYVETAQTASFVTTAQTASFVTTAQTASYVETAQTASFVTGSNVYGTVTSASYALTASYAVSASFEIIKELSSSYADTASYVETAQTASFVTTAQTASFVTTAQTASYVETAQTASFITTAQTASFVITSQTASYVETAQTASFITGSNVYGPHGENSIISSSHAITSSFALTASFIENVPTSDTASFVTGSNVHGPYGENSIISSSNAQTASYVTTAQTASYVTTAQTASFVTTAQTASYVTLAQTASFVTTAQTASYVETAQTASFVTTAQTASFVTTAQTASFVTTAQTASYVETAQTASYVETAQTASFVTTAQTASFVTTAQTASYVTTAQTASYVETAQSASYIPNLQQVTDSGKISTTGIDVSNITSSEYIMTNSGKITASLGLDILQERAGNSVNFFNPQDGTVKIKFGIGDPIDTTFSSENLYQKGDITASNLIYSEDDIIARGDLSASGYLFADLDDNDTTTFKTVVYDTDTGKFYRTGSYGGAGGDVINADTASFVTGSNVYGPLGSNSIKDAVTASFVTTAQTASYVETAQTASFVTTAQTASYVETAQTASFVTTAQTASYVTTAQTASFVTTAQTASFVTTAQTASYVETAQTASYVASASYTPNLQQVTDSGKTTSLEISSSKGYALPSGGDITSNGVLDIKQTLDTSTVNFLNPQDGTVNFAFGTEDGGLPIITTVITNENIDHTGNITASVFLKGQKIVSEEYIEAGSDIYTTSGKISSSGELYFSSSRDNNEQFQRVVQDTSTGKLYITGEKANDFDGDVDVKAPDGKGGKITLTGSNDNGTVNVGNTGSFIFGDTKGGLKGTGTDGEITVLKTDGATKGKINLQTLQAGTNPTIIDDNIRSTGNIIITGSLHAKTNITASGNISASGYISASEFIGLVTTAQTASFVTGSNVYGPHGSNSVISSSHAITASVALNVFNAPTLQMVTSAGSVTTSSMTTGAITVNTGSGGIVIRNQNNTKLQLQNVAPYYYPALKIGSSTITAYSTSGNILTITNSGYRIKFGSNIGYMEFISSGHQILQATKNIYLKSGGANTRLFVSQSGEIGINKTSALNADLDILGNQIITGSLEVTGGITGSLLGTASYVESSSYAITASHALNVAAPTLQIVTDAGSITTTTITGSNISASGFISASEFIGLVTTAQTASYVETAQTASFVITAQTASYVETAQTASFITTAQTASYVITAQTASFVTTAQTASYILADNIDQPFTNITSSGNISASGNIIANNVFVPSGGKISFDDSLDGTDQFITGQDDYIIIDGDNTVDIRADTNIKLQSSLIDNMSAGSEFSFKGSLYLTSSANKPAFIDVKGPITASNISSSGIVYAGAGVFNGSGIFTGSNGTVTIDPDSTTIIDIQDTSGGSLEAIKFRTSTGGDQIRLTRNGGQNSLELLDNGGNSVNLNSKNPGFYLNNFAIGKSSADANNTLSVKGNISASGAINTLSHITSSGNISASGGNIFGNVFNADTYVIAPNVGGSTTTLVEFGNQSSTHSNEDTDIVLKTQGSGEVVVDIGGNDVIKFLQDDIAIGKPFRGLTIASGSWGYGNLIVSGSINAKGPTGNITASGNISSSGNLFANITDNSDTNFKTVMYDTVTGQFFRTGSYGGGGGGDVENADTASFVTGSNVHGPHGPNSIISSSNAQTASFVTLAQTASYVITAQTASFVTTAQTASYVTLAQTASFVTTAQTASYVETAQTASYVTTAQTASFVTTAQTASYVTTSQTASFITGSNVYGPHGSNSIISSSHAQTASFVTTAQTASFVTTAQTASYVTTAQTASYVTTAQTSSYILADNIDQPFTNITASGNISASGDIIGNTGSFNRLEVNDSSLLSGSAIITGSLSVEGPTLITGSAIISSSNSITPLILQSSGSTVFEVQGSQGQLFSVSDDLIHDVLLANDISGNELFKVSGSGLVSIPEGDLSASKSIFFSSSLSNDTNFKTLVYDTSTGKIFHTGSYGGGGSGTTPNLQNVTDAGNLTTTTIQTSNIDTTGSIVASSNISSSGKITGLTGSFGRLEGLSPIVVGDSITFQSNITASGDISASGNLFADVIDSADTQYKTVVVDPITGRFFRTGSYGIGGFDGDYNNLTNKPTLFDGAYSSLTGKPTLFDGAYSSLTGKPTLFDGAFASLTSTPTTIAGYGITDAFDGAYNSLTGKPTLFDGAYSSLTGKPTLFDGAFASLTSTPTTIAGYGITDSTLEDVTGRGKSTSLEISSSAGYALPSGGNINSFGTLNINQSSTTKPNNVINISNPHNAINFSSPNLFYQGTTDAGSNFSIRFSSEAISTIFTNSKLSQTGTIEATNTIATTGGASSKISSSGAMYFKPDVNNNSTFQQVIMNTTTGRLHVTGIGSGVVDDDFEVIDGKKINLSGGGGEIEFIREDDSVGTTITENSITTGTNTTIINDNIATTGDITLTGSLYAKTNITASGNIKANNFIGSGTNLTGVRTIVTKEDGSNVDTQTNTLNFTGNAVNLSAAGGGSVNVAINTFPPTQTITSNTTLSSADVGFYNIVTHTANLTITISNTGLTAGDEFYFFNASAAEERYVTFAAGENTVICASGTPLRLKKSTNSTGQGAYATLKFISGTTFHLYGDID